ncbi:MBL fold metallo-hydrolase [Paraburkholderia caribensis]|nr:MBL fold metallo-hydrolase [Paraburkholderia caribensis]
METGIEVDFLPVGEGEHSGDAICVRWGVPGDYKVMVYDGGTEASGKALVEHIKKYYGTTHVDYVVNSHPDRDHASGLAVVLKELSVGEVWMHRPWSHSEAIRHYFADQRMTDASLSGRLQRKMGAAYKVDQLAEEKGVPIYEPFVGAEIGIFHVLSPTKDRYIDELLPAFEKSPELKEKTFVESLESIFDSITGAIKKAINYVAEQWSEEHLPETVETSAENESSVVLHASVQGRGFVLTGDAGIQSLRKASESASFMGINVASTLHFAQIPHHGGRHNVSTETLDLFFGSRNAAQDVVPTRVAFVSASKEAPTHPKKRVVNAFVRRGYIVNATKGSTVSYGIGMPARDGWTSAPRLAFSDQVEE